MGALSSVTVKVKRSALGESISATVPSGLAICSRSIRTRCERLVFCSAILACVKHMTNESPRRTYLVIFEDMMIPSFHITSKLIS